VELILQTLPGEQRSQVLEQLEDWLQELVDANRPAFPCRPRLHFRRRWMVPTAMDPDHPLVATLTAAVTDLTGRQPHVVGAPYPCDLFALQQIFDMPALVFGPTGANAHAADEYVELDSIHTFCEALLLLVMRWCGVQSG